MIRKIKEIKRQIWEIHKRSISIEKEQTEIRKLLSENNWANVFNSAIAGSTWFKDVPLNVGRWAAGYPLLYVLYRILNELRPQNILELGMGETTMMFQHYKMNLNPDATCVTVEHNLEWIETKKRSGFSEGAIEILTPELDKIEIKGKQTLRYKSLTDQLRNGGKRFNLLLIDGPFGSENYSRYNVIELIENNFLANDFIIIMDDYNRSGERETIDDVRVLINEKGIKFTEGVYAGEKSSCIIASEHYALSTSL